MESKRNLLIYLKGYSSDELSTNIKRFSFDRKMNIAIKNNILNLFKETYEKGAYFSTDDKIPYTKTYRNTLEKVGLYCDLEFIKHVVEKCDYNSPKYLDILFHNCVMNSGKIDAIKYLVKKGSNVSSYDLLFSILYKNFDYTKYFLKLGINYLNSNDLFSIVIQDSVEMSIKFIYENKIKFNHHKMLMEMIKRNDGKMENSFNFILNNYKVKVNLGNSRTDNLLSVAVKFNNINIVKMLVEYGANVNYESGTPLRIALENNHKDIILYLVENGAKFYY
jgi:hypothetical protein